MWRNRVIVLLALGLCISVGAPANELPKGVHAGIGYENGGHESVGPYKVKSFMRLDDQFGAGERIGLATTHAGVFDELRGVVVSYEQPFLTHWRATLAAGWSIAQPGGLIGRFYDDTTKDYSLSGHAELHSAAIGEPRDRLRRGPELERRRDRAHRQGPEPPASSTPGSISAPVTCWLRLPSNTPSRRTPG